jgi:hypothetical protein
VIDEFDFNLLLLFDWLRYLSASFGAVGRKHVVILYVLHVLQIFQRPLSTNVLTQHTLNSVHAIRMRTYQFLTRRLAQMEQETATGG